MNFSERFDLSRLPWQRAARLGPLLAWGGALAITAWVAADLFWRFSAPRPPALPVAGLADPQAAAQAIASRHLMGQSASGPAATVAAPSRYVLQAVVTGSGGRPGWAVIAIDGGAQQGFVEGQDIQPGVSLALVRGDSVELATGGLRQTIKLAERGNGGADAAASPPPAGGMAAIATPAQNFSGEASPPPETAQRPFPAGFPAQPVTNQ